MTSIDCEFKLKFFKVAKLLAVNRVPLRSNQGGEREEERLAAMTVSFMQRAMPIPLFLIIVSFIAAVHSFSSNVALRRFRSSSSIVHCNGVDTSISPEFLLSDKELLQFMRDGHLLKRGLINPGLITETVAPSLLQLYNQNILTAWKHKLKINLGLDMETTKDYTVPQCEKLLEDVDKEEIPFMQLFNLWYASDDVRSLALSTELGAVAAQLLGI